MKTLDRYIVQQFLINFVILLTVFTLLFVLVDVIVDMDEFIKAGRLKADTHGGVILATAWAFVDYYGPMLILLYAFFAGLIVVAAVGFTLSSLARTRELTAMVSSGISMHRIAAPLVVVGCLINGLTLLDQELVIPKLAYKLTRSKSQLSHETNKAFEVRYAVDSKGHLISAAKFDVGTDEPMLTGVTILERDSQGRAKRRITAEQAFWNEPLKGWELVGGYGITPDQTQGPAGASLPFNTATPEKFFATDLSPQVLLAFRTGVYPRLLSLGELRDLAANPAVNDGPIRKIMHSRFSLLVLNVLVLIVGLPFFLMRQPANMLHQGIMATAACLAVWAAGVFLPESASAYMNPVASAWLPVVVFLPLSAAWLQTIQT